MTLYRLEDEASLEAPVMVAAFDGWVDAGGAGTAAAQELAAAGRAVATFDADSLYDYRARRPTLDIVDGALVSLEWPQLRLVATRVAERDLLVLTGAEPDYRWQELTTDIVALARRLEVSGWASLGAIPAAVAHTRPVPVLGTASARGILPPGLSQGPDGLLRVPSAMLSVLEHAMARAGFLAIGIFAQVPHYVSGAYPTAAIELLRHLGAHLQLELPLGDLPARALETRTMLDAAAAADERTKAYVERLEAMADEARLPSGDDLIADIERFLRDRGGGESGGGDGEPRLH